MYINFKIIHYYRKNPNYIVQMSNKLKSDRLANICLHLPEIFSKTWEYLNSNFTDMKCMGVNVCLGTSQYFVLSRNQC